jgi:Uma2 family endonuclease
MGIEFEQPARAGQMTGSDFRAFQDRRPDHERWELIAGVPTQITTPPLTHNRIAGNLERLLNDALAVHAPDRVALQRPGIELGSSEFRPEPAVAVIDAVFDPGQRFVERAYLLAEIVSSSDDMRAPETGAEWIEVKRSIYLAHPACEAVLTIEQERMEVRVDVRTKAGWTSQTLGAADELHLSGFGLRCAVAQIYDGTPLRRRTQ